MTPRTRPWWHTVADDPTAPPDATAPPPDDVRDPWADRPLEVAALTTAQQAVLAGFDDQPAAPRLDGIAAELDGVDDLDNGSGAGGLDPVATDPDLAPQADDAPLAYGNGAGAAVDLGHDQPTVPRFRPDRRGAPGASGRNGDRVDDRAAGRGPGAGPGEGTGSAPGDPGAVGPQTRTRWTEQEQQER